MRHPSGQTIVPFQLSSLARPLVLEFPPERFRSDQGVLLEHPGRKSPSSLREPNQTRWGHLRDISWNNTILRDLEGNVLGTASIGEDVTERKRAEERVRELAGMLNHAHDAIIVRDIQTARITFWDQGAARLYGWTAAEVEGREMEELIYLDPSKPEEITSHLIATGEWHGELKHLTKDGGKLIVSSHATLMRDAKGRPKSAR